MDPGAYTPNYKYMYPSKGISIAYNIQPNAKRTPPIQIPIPKSVSPPPPKLSPINST